ncbi:MAG: hypothetical protein K5929_02680 [Lachnospiraceae bacterium]|nr:hypothetical protein [Lachnospiraceae bacterium]
MADRKDRDVIEIEELEDIGETDKDMYKARKSRMKEERGKFYSISRMSANQKTAFLVAFYILACLIFIFCGTGLWGQGIVVSCAAVLAQAGIVVLIDPYEYFVHLIVGVIFIAVGIWLSIIGFMISTLVLFLCTIVVISACRTVNNAAR